jgi:crotonobetainyl-CoA:carnitine CoA-transferase CaiB-like acyl-CoA transferase
VSGPLDGITVVDCTRGLAGPRATGLLADYGADVWWVEPPGGDPFRDVLKTEYAVFNRGKRSVELDLKSEAGRERLFDLLSTADLFVTSWRPGVAVRLGVDWSRVNPVFPRLVHTSITGFGEDGTLADIPGHEAVVQSYVGVTAEQVGLRPPPIYEGLPFASIGAAYLALIGSLAALYRRVDDGRGRLVQTSLVDGALSYLGMVWGDADDVNAAPPIVPGSIRLISRSFRCADDEYIGVHTGAVGAFGRLIRELGLAGRIGVAEDGSDMRVPLSEQERVIVLDEIPTIFETQSRDVWLKRLLDADVAAIPELRPGQIFDEPQVRHNGMVIEVDDPVLGSVEQVAPAIRFQPGFDVHPGSAAPTVGQHNADLPARRTVVHAMPSSTGDDGPLLDGLRVLDAGAYYAGPFSSRLLADLGADVIKLETTLGDQLRGIKRPFRSASAGKRAVSFGLKDPDLHEARDGLIKWAHVVLHNMRPGAAERVGLGREQVHALNPDAVYLYAPGWGSTGPDAMRQSFAPLMSGYVGIGYEVGGQFNPPMWPLGNEDPGNGLTGAVGILMALLRNTRTGGGGSYVENPQLNATMTHAAHIVRRADGTVLGAERLDPLQTGVGPLDRLYETSDGWICVVALRDDEIRRLETVLGVRILDDPRFASHELRLDNGYELSDAISEVLLRRSSQEWWESLRAAGVAAMIPKTETNNQAFHRDPVNQAIGRIAQVADGNGHFVREAATMVRVSGAETAVHRLAPEFGADTDQVLAELGYAPERIADLRARGAIK